MGSGDSLSCDISLNTQLSPQQRAQFQHSPLIRRLLSQAQTIAIVGLSSHRQKASYFVANYLQTHGYRIIPIHPQAETILGERCYPDLPTACQKLEVPIDIANFFRPPQEIPSLVEQAIACHIPTVWMQLRLVDLEAAEKAQQAGLHVIVDKCIKMEHGRYHGTLAWGGMNTEIISAQKIKK